MRYIITLTLILFSLQDAYTQGFSVGIRSGVGASFDASEFCNSNKHYSWNNEAYSRYETNGTFAFEARAGHYKSSNGGKISQGPLEYNPIAEGNYPGNKRLNSLGRNNYYLSFSTQYDITCPAMQERCSFLKKINSFIGLDVAGVYTNELIEVEEHQNSGDIQEYTYNDETLNLLFGISHTLQYSLTEQLNINSSVRMMINPGDFSQVNNELGSQLSFMLGAGYKF